MNTLVIVITACAHQLAEAFNVTLRITPGHCCWDNTVQIRGSFCVPHQLPAWCNHFRHGELPWEDGGDANQATSACIKLHSCNITASVSMPTVDFSPVEIVHISNNAKYSKHSRQQCGAESTTVPRQQEGRKELLSSMQLFTAGCELIKSDDTESEKFQCPPGREPVMDQSPN